MLINFKSIIKEIGVAEYKNQDVVLNKKDAFLSGRSTEIKPSIQFRIMQLLRFVFGTSNLNLNLPGFTQKSGSN